MESRNRKGREGARVPVLLLPAFLCLVAGLASASRAGERVFRVYDEKDGLAVSEISELAQDSCGFIWVGTIGGAFRFDGKEMRHWAPDSVRHTVRVVSPGPAGALLLGGAGEPLYRVERDGVRPLLGPDNRRMDRWVDAAFSGDGAVWVALADTLYRFDSDRDSAPSSLRTAHDFDGSPFFRVLPAPGEDVLISTEQSLWRAGARGSVTLLARLGRVQYAGLAPDSSWILLTRTGLLYRLEGDSLHLLIKGSGHGRGLAMRGNTIWASIDQYVYTLKPGAPPEIVAPRSGTPTGRPMIIDREGSLWIGGYRGLVLMPEPETVAWNDEDGLPSPTHARFVTKCGNSLWIGTWYGAGRIDCDGERRSARTLYYHSGRFCPDGFGGLWTGALDSGFVHIRAGRREFYPFPGNRGVYAYFPRADGTLWLGSDEGLFLTSARTSSRASQAGPRRARTTPPRGWGATWDGIYLSAIIEDHSGTLWLASGESVAHAPAAEVARGDPVSWIEEALPRSEVISALIETPSGCVWASSWNRGVMRRRDDGVWEDIPAARALASSRVHALVRSPAGGIWIAGAGSVVRVEEDTAGAGWNVLEELTSWQGIPNEHATDIWEESDGRLWLATLAGVVEIPPEVRRMRKDPPPVELVDLQVDGSRLPLGPIPDLPYRRNRLELHAAALSFRDRGLIRYRIRLRPDRPWFESRDPMVRFVDLAPGRYEAEIRASIDGEHWSAEPARVEFHVHRPWFLQGWAIAFYVAAVTAILYAVHRVRVAFLLRLERQRTRIAMDLHDEMGSGLGSIGILAGLAAENGLEERELKDLAERIAQAAGEMGGALTDIVTSLRNGADTIESLSARLAERANRLVPGPGAELRLRLPETPVRVRLDPVVQRNAQLIATEALHNAARHSGARRVELGLEPQGHLWRLWVEDDGRGIPAHAWNDGGGYGLRNMRDRAAAIGAEISWSSERGARPAMNGGDAMNDGDAATNGAATNRSAPGTRVELLFNPQPGGGRLSRMIMRVLWSLPMLHSQAEEERRSPRAHRDRRG